MHTNHFRGIYFNITLIFVLTSLGWVNFMVKNFLYLVIRHKKEYAYNHNFSVSFFSSSEIHQSHHLDGCQVIGIYSYFIFAF